MHNHETATPGDMPVNMACREQSGGSGRAVVTDRRAPQGSASLLHTLPVELIEMTVLRIAPPFDVVAERVCQLFRTLLRRAERAQHDARYARRGRDLAKWAARHGSLALLGWLAKVGAWQGERAQKLIDLATEGGHASLWPWIAQWSPPGHVSLRGNALALAASLADGPEHVHAAFVVGAGVPRPTERGWVLMMERAMREDAVRDGRRTARTHSAGLLVNMWHPCAAALAVRFQRDEWPEKLRQVERQYFADDWVGSAAIDVLSEAVAAAAADDDVAALTAALGVHNHASLGASYAKAAATAAAGRGHLATLAWIEEHYGLTCWLDALQAAICGGHRGVVRWLVTARTGPMLARQGVAQQSPRFGASWTTEASADTEQGQRRAHGQEASAIAKLGQSLCALRLADAPPEHALYNAPLGPPNLEAAASASAAAHGVVRFAKHGAVRAVDDHGAVCPNPSLPPASRRPRECAAERQHCLMPATRTSPDRPANSPLYQVKLEQALVMAVRHGQCGMTRWLLDVSRQYSPAPPIVHLERVLGEAMRQGHVEAVLAVVGTNAQPLAPNLAVMAVSYMPWWAARQVLERQRENGRARRQAGTPHAPSHATWTALQPPSTSFPSVASLLLAVAARTATARQRRVFLTPPPSDSALPSATAPPTLHAVMAHIVGLFGDTEHATPWHYEHLLHDVAKLGAPDVLVWLIRHCGHPSDIWTRPLLALPLDRLRCTRAISGSKEWQPQRLASKIGNGSAPDGPSHHMGGHAGAGCSVPAGHDQPAAARDRRHTTLAPKEKAAAAAAASADGQLLGASSQGDDRLQPHGDLWQSIMVAAARAPNRGCMIAIEHMLGRPTSNMVNALAAAVGALRWGNAAWILKRLRIGQSNQLPPQRPAGALPAPSANAGGFACAEDAAGDALGPHKGASDISFAAVVDCVRPHPRLLRWVCQTRMPHCGAGS
jgi:hypothetical protein